MLCEDCRQRVATVVYTEVREGAKEVWHLCQQCVEERGIHAPDIKSPLDSENPFEGMLIDPEAEDSPAEEGQPGDERTCTACGWSFGRFRKTGRFGCPECYDAFEDHLKVLLRQIHGSNEHLGKVYAVEEKATGPEDLLSLRHALEEAIGREAFEEAAELRDRIRRAEKRGG